MNDLSKCKVDSAGQRLKQSVAKLTVECPLTHKNPAMCPLNPVRKQRPASRLKWIESLKPEDLDFLVRYHKVCLKWQKAGCP